MNRIKTVTALAAITLAMSGPLSVNATSAKPKPPGYMIIEYEVTDQAGFREYLKASAEIRKSLPSGTFLARGAKGISLSGEPPKTTAIIRFSSVEEALAFDRSPQYSALKEGRDQAIKWRSFVVEGLGE